MTPPAAEIPQRVLILGGGFGGLYAALEMERTLARDPDVEVTLVSGDNFFLFTPLLHEVAASDVDITHIVNPLHKLLKRVNFFCGQVEAIDLPARRVRVSHGTSPHTHELPYDHLVLALGAVTNFLDVPGVAQRALTLRTLGDAVVLRNHLIESLEVADSDCFVEMRAPLLTVVVAGGGFAGVETAGAVSDFLHDAVRHYPNLRRSQPRVVLVHSGPALLPELGPELGAYAARKLADNGVDVRLGTRVAGQDDQSVTLSDNTTVPAGCLVWTAGTCAHPLLETLPCGREKGRVGVDPFLQVPGWPGVWAVGDAALIPDPKKAGTFYPPTAQHALREGTVVARNIAAAIRGSGRAQAFVFSTIGQLASIGRRRGVAHIAGVNFSGFLAWWLWRTIYLSKLPRLEKKLRVVLDWTLDLFFSKDLVQFTTSPRDPGKNDGRLMPGEAAGQATIVPGDAGVAPTPASVGTMPASSFLALALLLLASAPTAAAPERVAWSARLEPAGPRAGEGAQIVVTAVIAKPWHLYAPTQPAGGSRPTTFVLAPGTLKAAAGGGIAQPPPKKKPNPDFKITDELFDGAVAFGIPVMVAARGARGGRAQKTMVAVRYQLCSERVCTPAKTTQLTVSFSVAPGPARLGRTRAVTTVPVQPTELSSTLRLWNRVGRKINENETTPGSSSSGVAANHCAARAARRARPNHRGQNNRARRRTGR